MLGGGCCVIQGVISICVIQGVISVQKPLDQALSYVVSVTATDNWNGTRGIQRVTRVTVS